LGGLSPQTISEEEQVMDKEKVRELAANVNSILAAYKSKEQSTAELFKICLEFLEDKGHEPHYTNADIQREGGVFKAQKWALIKRRERKQQLIAAVKGYIKMIEERDKSNG